MSDEKLATDADFIRMCVGQVAADGSMAGPVTNALIREFAERPVTASSEPQCFGEFHSRVDGPTGALVCDKCGQSWKYPTVRIPKPGSPIGSGETVEAAFIAFPVAGQHAEPTVGDLRRALETASTSEVSFNDRVLVRHWLTALERRARKETIDG